MFPEQFRDQLLEQANSERKPTSRMDSTRESFNVNNAKSSLKTFMAGASDAVDDDELFLTKPVADLFPEGESEALYSQNANLRNSHTYPCRLVV